MPRMKAVTPKGRLTLKLPPELLGRLHLHLVSEVEGRIPKGDIGEFFAARLKEYFDWEVLDLSLYGFPTGYFVRGPTGMIESLRGFLAENRAEV